MADSTHADEGANAGPNRPVSQIPGQGSPRLETLYRLFSVPTGILGLLMLLLPGQTTSGAGGLKSVGAKISAATPEGRMFSTQLRILGVALISAAVIKHLLARAARNGDLGKGPYLRLNVALLLWSLLSLVLVLCSPTVFSVFSFTLLVAITAGTVAFTLPQVLSTNVSGALDQAVREVRAGKTRRSWIYAMLALFFLLEGIGLVMTPGLTLRGAFGMNGGAVGNELWQLIGASAHVLVPIALLQLASAAERAKLASTVNATLNKVVLAVAATHVVTLLRHGLFGPVGPLGPPVLLAWATALGTTIYNLPSFGKLESQARITKQE